jgi:hypothetical protein
VTIRDGTAYFTQTVVESQLANLTLIETTLQIEFGFIPISTFGEWTLIDFGILYDEYLDCTRLSTLSVDVYSLPLYSDGWHPQKLNLLEFDEYNTAIFSNDRVTFSRPGSTVQNVTISVDGYNSPRLLLNSSAQQFTFLSDPGATNFTSVIELALNTNQVISLGKLPESFHALFGSGLNGILKASGNSGLVPVEMSGNIDVDIMSRGGVQILSPWSLDSYFHPESVPFGFSLYFEEAYFGPKSNIIRFQKALNLLFWMAI